MTTLNIKNPTYCDDDSIKSGPDLKIAFSLLKQRFYFSLIPLLIGFVCWMLEGSLLSPFKSSDVIITMKETIFSAYWNYMDFLLLMGAISIIIKMSQFLKTLFLKSSKNDRASIVELAERNDIEACSRVNVKAQKISMKIGWFFLHFSLIFCLYYLIGSCIPSLSLHTKPSSNLLFSVPSTSKLIKSSRIDQTAIQFSPVDHIVQDRKLSLEDDAKSQIELPMSRILGKLNLPHAQSLIVCQERNIAFVSVSKPNATEMVKIVSISDLENPQVLRSIKLNHKSEFPLKSLALSPDNKVLVVSNMIWTDIVDVTDLLNPQVRGHAESKAFNEKFLTRLADLSNTTFRVSIAFSGDGTAVFIAGVGLLGYNISDMATPKEILSDLETFEKNEPLMSSVSVQDNTLYVAHGILKSYNISDLNDIRYFPTKTRVNSLVIYQQNETKTKKLYVIGRSEHDVILEEIDISDSANMNETNFFKLDMDVSQVPMLFEVTKSGENLFLTSGLHDLHIFNFTQRKCIYRNFENLIKPISSLTISQHGHHVYVIANQLLVIYKLYKDYPNKRIFSSTSSILGNHPTGYPGNFMSLISNDKILILATSKCRVKSDGPDNCQGNEAAIELFDVSNPAHPENITTYPLPVSLKAFMVFPKQSQAYVTLENRIQVFNLSNNNPILIREFFVEKETIIKNSVFTPDGKIGFLYENVSNHFSLTTYDFSNVENITRLGSVDLRSEPFGFDILLSNNTKTIFIIGNNTIKIDVSNPCNPRQINSLPIVTDEKGYGYAGFLTQNQNLFIKVRDSDENSNSLQFYNVSNETYPYVLPDFPLLKSNNIYDASIVPSPLYSDLIYLASNTDKGDILLAINISNATKPVLQGTVPVSKDSGDIVSFVISSDGKIAYISTQSIGLQIVQLQVSHTLFLESETFENGPKVSTKAHVLSLNSEKEYIIMNPSDFKVLEVSLFDLRIPSYSKSIHFSNSQLPYWMAFDKENGEFVLHPQQVKDVGVYGLRSVYSTKVKMSELNKIRLIGDNETLHQELIECLINDGYLDNQRFLTSAFDKFENSPLEKKFESAKKDIQKFLKEFYFETFTMFEIFSSLEVDINNNKEDKGISITTPSDNNLRVYISLEVKNSSASARFLDKQYALLKPVINNSELTLVGSLWRINAAFKELVIDLENTENCDGAITVDDQLNPVFTKKISNIATYFKNNIAPSVNETILTHFEEKLGKQSSINGGEYFVIPLNNLFFDNYSDSLTYTLVEVSEDNEEIPVEWLTIEDGFMGGTPPEERSGDEIKLKLTAKNFFKSKDIPLTLKIQKTKMHVAKEVYHAIYLGWATFGTLLSWICFKIWTNYSLIHNIYYRSSYKHSKDFYLEVGQEITSNILYPIFFLKAENEQSQLILRELGKRIAAKNDGQEAFTDFEISQYFVQKFGEISKEDIKNEIREGNISLGSASPESHALIIQLIFNALIQEQLHSPDENSQVTRRVFQTIEKECEDWVNWEKFPECPIKEEKLQKLETLNKIKEISFTQASSHDMIREENDLNESLINQSNEEEKIEIDKEINIKLLKCAIGARALQKQMINELLVESNILVKGVKNIKNRAWLWCCKIFKKNLIDINFTDINNRITYGIQYDVNHNKLSFAGIVDESFLNKTIVVQIATRPWNKILKEIYIHGIQGPSRIGLNIVEVCRGPALEMGPL